MAEVLHHTQRGSPVGAGAAAPAGVARPATASPGSAGRQQQPAFSSAAAGRREVLLQPGVRHYELQDFGADAAAAAAAARSGSGASPSGRPLSAGSLSRLGKVVVRRAAERAVLPQSPLSGLGERIGAPLPAHEPCYGWVDHTRRDFYAAAAVEDIDPDGSPGRAQRNNPRRPITSDPNAGVWSPVEGQHPRELWPKDMAEPPRRCMSCNGPHDAHREQGQGHAYEPYTPRMRLDNLGMLQPKFTTAAWKGELPVELSDSRVQPLRWLHQDAEGRTLKPDTMGAEEFCRWLPLMLDGIREGHEPLRFLALKASQAFLDSGSAHLAAALPACVRPLKLCFNTYEPSLVGTACLMLRRLLACHPHAGRLLLPAYKHFLPILGLFRKKRTSALFLPPPYCVAPTGSFTAKGPAPDAGRRACHVCGMPVDKEHDKAAAIAAAAAPDEANAALYNAQAARARPYKRNPLLGRSSQKYLLGELIESTLEAMVEAGGPDAYAAVQRGVPGFTYCNPRD